MTEERQLNIQQLVKMREKLFRKIQGITVAAEDMQATGESAPFEVRYRRLGDIYQEYEDVQIEIEGLAMSLGKEGKAYLQDSAAFEEMYFRVEEAHLKLERQQAKESQTTAQSTQRTTTEKVNLPPIRLQTFSGRNIEAFPTFISLFESLVHKEPSLNDVQRFHYLSSSLEGHAASVIKNIPITGENYGLALQSLKDRYENKRLQASFHLERIINFKSPPKESLESLREFLEVFGTSVKAYRNLPLPHDDFLLFFLALHGLHPETRKLFEATQSGNAIPSFKELLEFTQQRCKIYELTLAPSSPSFQKSSPTAPKAFLPRIALTSTSESSRSAATLPCDICSQIHKFHSCPSFLSMNYAARVSAVKKWNRCFTCLGKHFRKDCQSKGKCKTCFGSHHSLLHTSGTSSYNSTPVSSFKTPPLALRADDKQTEASSKGKETGQTLEVPQPLSCLAAESSLSTVLLGTVQALARDSVGSLHQVRILLDPGSQSNFVTTDCAERLGLKRKRCSAAIKGLGNLAIPANKGSIDIVLFSRNSQKSPLKVCAVILDNISPPLPTHPVSEEVFRRFSHLELADDHFNSPAPIDMLLDAAMFSRILNSDVPIGSDPTALSTVFGWVILGESAAINMVSPDYHCGVSLAYPTLETLVQQFWELEDFRKSNPPDPEEVMCEQHFLKTHYRDQAGHYVVALPFRRYPPATSSLRPVASKRLSGLERRLASNPQLKREYSKFLKEYEELGHMQLAHAESQFVIPHHCVLKPSSSTTKIRVVFDASAKPSTSSPALNEELLPGPRLQPDITLILLRLRLFKFVLCADIRMMYRQILLHPDHRKFQHILWRESPHEEVREYELNTVTYGMVPSAYLAQRVLRQLVTDEGHRFPRGAQVLLKNSYVDDLAFGGESIADAQLVKQQVTELLSLGGFSLRKWASNNTALLQDIPVEHRESLLFFDAEDEGSALRILGIKFRPSTDSFSYSVKFEDTPFTKRGILSVVARMYDPLGWLTPVILWAKVLIQKTWLLKLEWDEGIPADLENGWKDFLNQLPLIETIDIPRFIPALDSNSLYLVGFCDASQKGYAAVLYLCCKTATETSSFILKAKSRVSPVKPATIPRLELCSAHLLARLYQAEKPLLDELPLTSSFFFTDSATVLAWLASPPHTLKTFVANRVVDILDIASVSAWRHLPSELNPADIGSRGALPKDLVSFSPWWNGPSFLTSDVDSWPSSDVPLTSPLPDVKVVLLSRQNELVAPSPRKNSVMEKCSTLEHLQRVVSFVLRLPHNARLPVSERRLGLLTSTELSNALLLCVRWTQEQHFSQLVTDLQHGRPINSGLRKLAPFLDEKGLVRVGGRLRHSGLPSRSKFPLLLPRLATLSRLICDYFHRVTLHGGSRLIQALINKQFWIINLRQLIKSLAHKCVRCLRFDGKPVQPRMADLPSYRFEEVRAFLNTGLDCAGPFRLKESSRRNARIVKAYMVLFVCLSTKAVHLELISDMSTPSLLHSLDRFFARRGLSKTLYSDRGSNFVGASRYLKEIFQLIEESSDRVASSLAHRGVQWHFNPPAAPHWGGIWEAAIKSAKRLLYRTIGDRALTHEEMNTFFARTEAILNSRPLVALNSDPNDDPDYLSPGHFLVGNPPLAAPMPLDAEPRSLTCRYSMIQQSLHQFWKLWRAEYLHTLQTRIKWQQDQPNLAKGDVVLARDRRTSPTLWPVGRVVEAHPGKDSIVRVVDVRIEGKIYQRPVNQLIRLPVHE